MFARAPIARTLCIPPGLNPSLAHLSPPLPRFLLKRGLFTSTLVRTVVRDRRGEYQVPPRPMASYEACLRASPEACVALVAAAVGRASRRREHAAGAFVPPLEKPRREKPAKGGSARGSDSPRRGGCGAEAAAGAAESTITLAPLAVPESLGAGSAMSLPPPSSGTPRGKAGTRSPKGGGGWGGGGEGGEGGGGAERLDGRKYRAEAAGAAEAWLEEVVAGEAADRATMVRPIVLVLIHVPAHTMEGFRSTSCDGGMVARLLATLCFFPGCMCVWGGEDLDTVPRNARRGVCACFTTCCRRSRRRPGCSARRTPPSTSTRGPAPRSAERRALPQSPPPRLPPPALPRALPPRRPGQARGGRAGRGAGSWRPLADGTCPFLSRAAASTTTSAWPSSSRRHRHRRRWRAAVTGGRAHGTRTRPRMRRTQASKRSSGRRRSGTAAAASREASPRGPAEAAAAAAAWGPSPRRATRRPASAPLAEALHRQLRRQRHRPWQLQPQQLLRRRWVPRRH